MRTERKGSGRGCEVGQRVGLREGGIKMGIDRDG